MTGSESLSAISHTETILRCEEITKRFGGLVAVNRVSLEVRPGEVIGLIGDNGAGKSTLIHVISGLYPPDKGLLYLGGKEVTFSSPMDARQMGIETIYQDLALAEAYLALSKRGGSA